MGLLVYGYGYGYLHYMIFMLPAILLGMIASASVKVTFKKYGSIPNSRGITGAQMARMILDNNNLQNVRIEQIEGELTDHYDPRAGVIRLSRKVYGSTSIGAIGVAAHEAGHAVQHGVNYVPIVLRNKVIPICNFGSKVGPILILLGLLFAKNQLGVNLILAGIILFSFVAVFQLITLPVEFNASRRALMVIRDSVQFAPADYKGAKSVLTAAALTYVAALLHTLMQILYYLTSFLRNRN